MSIYKVQKRMGTSREKREEAHTHTHTHFHHLSVVN